MASFEALGLRVKLVVVAAAAPVDELLANPGFTVVEILGEGPAWPL